ncbi:type II toxin-antitoxin system RelE/ParE family toxin [Xanthobacter autotrophicus]|uniref:type II toxin-antitoxin system RelE/ParE family toxin n=1 Tax=Xanthobacter TaxID=279 RepID=UPI0024ABD1DC|nr:type II toxin-antitoxin system RelE/ParE family toxin [Xanthobacter autotrophicus]MDI4662921.1 type II toxin-antitoxin system RelE/ParE family toxin [Xanthobacter autotrophicus]
MAVFDRPMGVTKAEAYVRLIAEALDMLARDLRGGMRADHVRPGYFRHLIGSHVVFYRFPHDGVLEVVRILHQRMDVARHLQRVIQAPDVWPPPALSGKRTMFQAFRQGRCDL